MNTLLRRKPNQSHHEDASMQQDAKVSQLRTAIGPLSGRSLKYCTDACLRRYLVAWNWKVDKAKKKLEETLKWRATYKPEEITWHEVAHEGAIGNLFRANFHDLEGRPILIMKPAMQNKNPNEDTMRHYVYLLENTSRNLPESPGQMSWLIDFTGFSLKSNVSIKYSLALAGILQNHYPETLGSCFIYNPPIFFWPLYKAIKYFLDPQIVQKVRFVYPNDKDSEVLMRSFFNVDNLPSEFGGRSSLKYDHEEFARLMTRDDMKTAEFWGVDGKTGSISNPHSRADTKPESLPCATPAS